MANADDFGPAAKKAYDDLSYTLTHDNPDYKVYWTQGHACDTAIDYLVWLADHDLAQAFAQIAHDAYKRGDDANWYDDYGWWGIAALRIGKRRDLFGPLAAPFNIIARECWTTMRTKAPAVWENAKKNPRYKDFEPRFPGGVRNSDWSSDCDPNRAKLCGFQNTVTNGLYLVLAARMYWEGDGPAFEETEYSFLKSWFNATPPADSLLNRYESNRVSVRERVTAYAATSK